MHTWRALHNFARSDAVKRLWKPAISKSEQNLGATCWYVSEERSRPQAGRQLTAARSSARTSTRRCIAPMQRGCARYCSANAGDAAISRRSQRAVVSCLYSREHMPEVQYVSDDMM